MGISVDPHADSAKDTSSCPAALPPPLARSHPALYGLRSNDGRTNTGRARGVVYAKRCHGFPSERRGAALSLRGECAKRWDAAQQDLSVVHFWRGRDAAGPWWLGGPE